MLDLGLLKSDLLTQRVMMLSVRIFTALSAASAVMPSISASVFLLFDHAPTSPPMPPPPRSARINALQNSALENRS